MPCPYQCGGAGEFAALVFEETASAEEDPVELMRDPREAIDNIMEALLFTYRYDAERRTFLLIAEYPVKSPGSVREFARAVVRPQP